MSEYTEAEQFMEYAAVKKRAGYGEKLLEDLSACLAKGGITN
jgi:hypothetical protein